MKGNSKETLTTRECFCLFEEANTYREPAPLSALKLQSVQSTSTSGRNSVTFHSFSSLSTMDVRNEEWYIRVTRVTSAPFLKLMPSVTTVHRVQRASRETCRTFWCSFIHLLVFALSENGLGTAGFRFYDSLLLGLKL